MSTDELKKTPGANGFIRTLSILAAAAVVALVVIYPRAVATDGASVPHGWFVLMMMGMSICWICGFGFTLRCFQRLSDPYVVAQLCSWRNNWCARGTSVPVLSY